MNLRGVLLLLLICASPALARPFTGTFIADGRPRWMGFLSLTQTDHSVNGFLLVAQPNDHGATTSETITVEGSADGNAMTLHSKTFLSFGSVTFDGRLSGSVLTLSFPSSSGRVES